MRAAFGRLSWRQLSDNNVRLHNGFDTRTLHVGDDASRLRGARIHGVSAEVETGRSPHPRLPKGFHSPSNGQSTGARQRGLDPMLRDPNLDIVPG
jgi:hypothetical protein